MTAGYCLMNYTVQCTDVSTGKTGCFLFDTDHYRRTGEFKAISEVFPDLVALFQWDKNTNTPSLCHSEYIERDAP